MKTLDPGHHYTLSCLDDPEPRVEHELIFVKREGESYPGNIGHYPGTTLQEVLRACIDRVKYLDNQIPDIENTSVLMHLRHAIYSLEKRAARRHGRSLPPFVFGDIEHMSVCTKCLHIGCDGGCHP